MQVIVFLFILFFNIQAYAQSLEVEVFVSTTCPHCHKALEWLDSIQPKRPWLVVKKQVINENKAALEAFAAQLKAHKLEGFIVPSFFFCGYRWVGFDTAEQSGKILLKALDYCHEHMDAQGKVSPAASQLLQQLSMSNWLDFQQKMQSGSSQNNLSTIAWIDAISICSWFYLLGLVAVIWRENTLKQRISVGLVFIAGIIPIHVIQLLYSNLYFNMLNWLIFPGILGALGVWYSLYKKPMRGLYLVSLFFVSAVLFAYQQSCSISHTASNGLWLAQQEVNVFSYLLYYFFYLLPLAVYFILSLYIASTQFYKKYATQFFIISSLLLFIILLCLVIMPKIFTNNLVSILALCIAVVAGVLFTKYLVRIFKRE